MKTLTRDTADRVSPLMYLQKNLIVESVVLDPTSTRPARLRFTTFDDRGSLEAEPVIVFHDAGEVIDMWTDSRLGKGDPAYATVR